MKNLRIVGLSLVLGMASMPSAMAQFKLDKDQVQAAIAKSAEQKDQGSAAGRRSSGGGTSGGAASSGKFSWGAVLQQNEERIAGSQTQQQGFSWGSVIQSRQQGTISAPGRGGVQSAIQKILKRQITVIAGTRVTDAVTGELLDDAREIRVDEDKKEEYYDDGTHGDLVAGDGQYTRVEEITGVIGPNNQRIKEQLIQALYEASRLDAREFYGHTLMSTDHSTRPERNVRWAMVDAPEGRAGFRLSEVATDKTVEVPDFWEEEMTRDMKIAGPNGWARTFLDEYRTEKGGLTSNFYTPYVPNPPTIPKVPPPSAEGWTPFVETYSEEDGVGGKAAQPGGGKAGGGGMSEQGARAAAAFVNRGAGKGSTAGGYFGAQ